MELTTTKYQIASPDNAPIRGLIKSDIVGLHTLLQQEGCIRTENCFTDDDKAISLDEIQRRFASNSKLQDTMSSMDILLCIIGKKLVLAEAKYRVEKVEHVTLKDIQKKISGTRDILDLVDFQIVNDFYILFTGAMLSQVQLNKLKRQFQAKPQFHFLTTAQFYQFFHS